MEMRSELWRERAVGEAVCLCVWSNRSADQEREMHLHCKLNSQDSAFHLETEAINHD